MSITKEQVKVFIQQVADSLGGSASAALGQDGSGWQGDIGNTTMAICGGIATSVNQNSVTVVVIDNNNFIYDHNLGRVPLVQAYDSQGRVIHRQYLRVTETQIIISGSPLAIGGRVVFI